MNANFSLSKSNKFLLVIFLILPLLKLIFSQKSIDAKLGAFTGEIFLFLFATACAWIVWRIFKRNHKAGSITFNILMSMLLVAKLADIGHIAKESHELKNLKNEQKIMKNILANTNNQEEIQSIYEGHTNNYKQAIGRLEKGSTGTKRLFYKKMGEFTEETQLARKKWIDSYDKVLNEESFNRILLTKEYKEIDAQKAMVKVYIEDSIEYKKYMSNIISILENKLDDLGLNNEYANDAIRGFKNGYKRRQPTLLLLIDEHIKYGNNLLEILNFLEKNTANWSYKDELQFADNSISEQYNLLWNEIEINKNAINTLDKKLIDLM